MKTIRDTRWHNPETRQFDVVPAGTEVKAVHEDDLVQICGRLVASQLIANRDRLQERGHRIVFGQLGHVRCWDAEDFQ